MSMRNNCTAEVAGQIIKDYTGLMVKAHTHTSILARSEPESPIESADSTTESADCTTDSVIVGRFSLLNMFKILNPLENRRESADNWSRPTANWPSGYGYLGIDSYI